MRRTGPAIGRVEFEALGGLAVVLTTDPAADVLDAAAEAVRAEVAAIDAACSRFRDDSELSRVNARSGEHVTVGPLFAQALTAALRAAELTNGDVDPTCGASLRSLGYDVDFAALAAGPLPSAVARAGAGWTAVEWDAARSRVRIPAGTALDFGATAKALAADRAARRAALATGRGVLVSLSGDIAVYGPAPTGGWHVRVADDHRHGDDAPGQTITVTEGGLATSSTTVRTWHAYSAAAPDSDQTATTRITVHHIVDPGTGRPATGCWRTATVAAATCLDANIAATAAIVRGRPAAAWLAGLRLPARLVRADGAVTTVGGWPAAANTGTDPATDTDADLDPGVAIAAVANTAAAVAANTAADADAAGPTSGATAVPPVSTLHTLSSRATRATLPPQPPTPGGGP